MDKEIETKKIMRKAIKSYAVKRESEVTNTQIKIYTESEKANPQYKILNSFNEDYSEEITLKQLMLVPEKLDLLQRGTMAKMFVEPTIKNILKRLGKEYKKDVRQVSVFIATSDTDCENLKLILCIDGKPFKRLKFNDVLD